MSGPELFSQGKVMLDFVIQIGVLIGMATGLVGFLLRYFAKKLDEKIDRKLNSAIKVLEDTNKEFDEHRKEVQTMFTAKAQIDTERYANITDSQKRVEIEIQKTEGKTEQVHEKLEDHLNQSSAMWAETKTKLSTYDQSMANFRSFIERFSTTHN